MMTDADSLSGKPQESNRSKLKVEQEDESEDT